MIVLIKQGNVIHDQKTLHKKYAASQNIVHSACIKDSCSVVSESLRIRLADMGFGERILREKMPLI